MGNSSSSATDTSGIPIVYGRPFADSSAKKDHQELTLDGETYKPFDIFVTHEDSYPSPIECKDRKQRDYSTLYSTRLYVVSNQKLTKKELLAIDNNIGDVPFPIFEHKHYIGVINARPYINFTLCDGPPTTASHYTEYRHCKQRNIPSNRVYDMKSGAYRRLVLPGRPDELVIIMPGNFVRTGLKKGYFHFSNNFIVRVFSKHYLSSRTPPLKDNMNVTVININDEILRLRTRKFFAKFGLHNLFSITNDQIIAQDSKITLVVGSIANVILPGSE